MHEMSNSFSGKIRKNISLCHLLKIFPRVLSLKIADTKGKAYSEG